MMNGDGKSDECVVPTKMPNKGLKGPAEALEGRRSTKGNTSQQNISRTQRRKDGMDSALERVRQVAKRDREAKFTALFHHVNEDRLRSAFYMLEPKSAPGIDGITWTMYQQDLDENLRSLVDRLHRGAYRAKPTRRVFIPKGDGGQRPLGIAALEDKIVQRAVVEVLNAIYEVEFLGFSYGFRPGRSAHQALDALAVTFERKRVNWVLDADIRGFFDAIDHGWMEQFVMHKIADPRILRLIQKWLKAGVIEEGKKEMMQKGSPQGATISPLLANIYLHYAFDLWVEQWRRKHAQGDVTIVRYADDFVLGFEHERDARRFQEALRQRLAKFGLELHPNKTRLIEFGRWAVKNRRKRGEGKPETFDFLGFTHICGESKRGRFYLIRRTMRERMRIKLKKVREALKRMRHEALPKQAKWVRSVLLGYYAYYGVQTNMRKVKAFRTQVIRAWIVALRRRGQKHPIKWTQMTSILIRWIPRERAMHPWPSERFAVRYPR